MARFDDNPVQSGGMANAIVAGKPAGPDSIDDLDVIRHGAMKRLFAEVHAPPTLGSFMRGLQPRTYPPQQLASVSRRFMVELALGEPNSLRRCWCAARPRRPGSRARSVLRRHRSRPFARLRPGVGPLC